MFNDYNKDLDGRLAAIGIVGLLTFYYSNEKEINNKIIEIINKLEPHISYTTKTISEIDPDLMQIGVSSAVVAVLTGILINLRKKELEEKKYSIYVEDDIYIEDGIYLDENNLFSNIKSKVLSLKNNRF